jgi:biotin carboxylase
MSWANALCFNFCEDDMAKKALILNTSHNDLRMILALKELGFFVIATGNSPGLVGQDYVDEYIRADYSDKEAMLALSKKLAIDYICACCNDLGVYTAAYIAEELNLPGYDDYKTTLTLHNKDKFKKFALDNNITTPPSQSFSDKDLALQFCKTQEFPLIVKPIDMSAGRGVSKIESVEDAAHCIEKAFLSSRKKRIIIESFIDGSQHGFCTFLINKKVAGICSNDEYSFVNPYRVEIDAFPATNFDEVKNTLVEQIEKMANLLNLHDGIFHLQYRMRGQKPYIIEVMRRTLGNLYMLPAQKLTGVNLDYWQARVYCGMDISGFPRDAKQEGFYAYRAVMATKNGIVKEIVIDKSLEKYIFDRCFVWDKVSPIKDFTAELLLLLFMRFDSRKEMEDVLLGSYDKIYAD